MRRLELSEVRERGQIARVPCSMSKEEFTEKFIRTRTPAIITGCNYKVKAKRKQKKICIL